MKNLQKIRGTRDFFNEEIIKKRLVEKTFFETTSSFNYKEIETPVVESEALFSRSVGEGTDIVQKEMFSFSDGTDSLVLRPEGTASVLRSVIENSMLEKLPLKLSYFGPMFRKERPQKGRYRQFYQCGIEVFGESSYGIELESFLLIKEFLLKLNIKDYVIEINNIGSSEERKKYKEDLVTYLSQFKSDLSTDSQSRLELNPLRILDSKNEKDREICKNAPLISNYLDSAKTDAFKEFTNQLDILGINYKLNPFLVRGLDYYSDLVFEIIDTSSTLGSQTALGGGGRYDKLVLDMSNKPCGGFGFAFGVDRLMLCEQTQNQINTIDISLITTSMAGLTALNIVRQDLLKAGKKVDLNFNFNLNFKKQFQRANKMNSNFVMVLGDNEIKGNFIKIKNMKLGTEEAIENVNFSNMSQVLIQYLNT